MAVESSTDFAPFVPLMAALIGGLLGGVGGNFIKYYLDTRAALARRDDASKIMADSLRGEIKSLRDQMKTFRRATKGYLDRLDDLEGGSEDNRSTSGMRIDLEFVSEIETPVFEANLENIGLLWRLIGKEVVEFYADFSALQRFSRRALAAEKDHVFDRRVEIFNREIHSLVGEATLVNSRLRRFSENPRDGLSWTREPREKQLIGQKSPPDG